MKNLSIITIAIAISSFSIAQKQSNYQSFEEVDFNDNLTKKTYVQFLDNQKTPLLKSNTEVFVINNKTWSRLYGEKNYCLTPVMDDVKIYEKRIAILNNKELNIYKSNFRFANIEVTDQSKTLLAKVNIFVPDYVKNYVISYLPQIDIEYLINNQVKVEILSNYGNKTKLIVKEDENVNNPKALIWSEGFESSAVPGGNYNANNGSVNCGWKDVSCYKRGGSWSVWCAGNGAACNACGGGYVNDMVTFFAPSNYINVSGFNDIFFNYWIDLDLNNSGTNDELRRYDDLGFGSWTLQFTATSAHPWDGQLWQQGSVNYTGQAFSLYAFQFGFVSNWTGTSFGVYIDDLQITGTSVVGIDELEQQNSKIIIYPNPSRGVFSLITEENVEKIEISDSKGKIVKTISNISQSQIEIDLSKQSKGVYLIKAVFNNQIITKRVVLN
ncbi:MAG: T9SS type A sorting domain-containing protein [Fluviicola sp.]|nr:T9SS type A sorting domain-containing protein [Fluviicola sp.]